MSDGRRYFAFGLQIDSQIVLPELAAVESPSGETDISIVYGAVPATLPGGRRLDQRSQVTHRDALLHIEETAAFRISDGAKICIDPLPQVDPARIRHFLLGLVLGVLLAQRGTIALHASAVDVQGHAVALIGRSGAGKSTLAAQLHRRGHGFICDDACVLEMRERATFAWPAIPQIKLWANSLDAIPFDVTAFSPVLPGLEKYYVPASCPVGGKVPLPLKSFYLIKPCEPHCEIRIAAVKGLAAFRIFGENVHGRAYHRHHHGESALLEKCMAFQRRVSIYSLQVPRQFELLEQVCDRLVAHVVASDTITADV